MMRVRRCAHARWFLFAASVALAAGCVVTDVGNPTEPKAQVTVGFDGYEASRSALVLDDGLEIEEAWIVVRELDFVETASCADDAPLTARGTVAVELLGGTVAGELPRFTTSAGEYCRLAATLGPLDKDVLEDDRVPAGLYGRSVLLRGRTKEGRPFSVRSGTSHTLTLLAGMNDPIHLDAGENTFVVGLAIDEWFEPERLEGLTDEPDIVVDEQRNTGELQRVLRRFLASARLFHDDNADARLDAAESVRPVAQAAPAAESSNQSNGADAGTAGN